jgi:hypothetical protein
MGAPPTWWVLPPSDGGGDFDAASVVALAIFLAAVLANYLAVRFAGKGPTPNNEGEAATRPVYREHAKVP